LMPNLFASHHLAGAFKQKQEQLKRLRLKANTVAILENFTRLQVDLE
jgi:hypothetical protein